MKVGKKLLSTLLAIMMIISSVSVCFGVLGADNSIESLMSQIELHHSSLIDLIEAAGKTDATEEDKKKALSSIGTNMWAVERDTATSSWHWVTYSYAQAADAVEKALTKGKVRFDLSSVTENEHYTEVIYELGVTPQVRSLAMSLKQLPGVTGVSLVNCRKGS